MEDEQYYMDIPVGKLRTPDYQRSVIKNHSLKSNPFDIGAANTLQVFKKEGEYFIGDGLQRYTAAIEQNGPEFKLHCQVYVEPTRAREIELFRIWNKDRRTFNALDTFYLSIREGNERSIEIARIVKEAGFTIGPGTRKSLNFTGIKTLEKIYGNGNDERAEILRIVLHVMKGAFGETPESTHAHLCKSVGTLLQRYEVDQEKLIDWLSGWMEPQDIIRNAPTNKGDGQEGRIADYIAAQMGLRPKNGWVPGKYRKKAYEISGRVTVELCATTVLSVRMFDFVDFYS